MTVRDDIRGQYHGVLADWARPCRVARFVSVVDPTGRESGTFQNVSTDEYIWIQPVSRGDAGVEQRGLDSRTTHMAFQRWDGLRLLPLDRIFDIDEQLIVNEYDVIRSHLKESHRVSELMLPVRNAE